MLMHQMNLEEIQQILWHLDHAIFTHHQWHNEIIRTTTCRLPCDLQDTIPGSHKECRFGQWYYSDNTLHIAEIERFITIGNAHQHIHNIARQLLIKMNTKNTIYNEDYEQFSSALENLKKTIDAFKSEIKTYHFIPQPT